jgi:hypothetical protein
LLAHVFQFRRGADRKKIEKPGLVVRLSQIP